MSKWAASLRIARRGAWQHKGRSALVIVMIGLPVAVIVFGAVALRTLQLEPEQQVTSQIGTAADAFVGKPGDRSFVQTPPPGEVIINQGTPIGGAPASIDELSRRRPAFCPRTSATAADKQRLSRPATASSTPRSASWTTPILWQPDLWNRYRVRHQRQPMKSWSPSRSPTLSASVSVTKSPSRISRTPSSARSSLVYGTDWDQVIGDVGAFRQVRFPAVQFGPDDAGTGWLVDVPGGLDYDQMLQINALGAPAMSRASPPTFPILALPKSPQRCARAAMLFRRIPDSRLPRRRPSSRW